MGRERVLAEMQAREIDLLILGREANARYVSGARRLWLAGTRAFAPGCVLVRATGAVHLLSVTDDGVPGDIAFDHLYPITWNPANLLASLRAIPGAAAATRIGVDGLTPLFDQLLRATFPTAELVDGEQAMRSARRLKDTAEISAIRAAAAVAESALTAAIDALRPGITERQLLGVFEQHMARHGATTPAQEGTFCVVPPRRRLVSERTVHAGDLVALNSGVLLDGWEAGLGRTWPCGPPTDDQRGWYAHWRTAFDRVVDACRVGATVADVMGVGGVEGADDSVAVHGVGRGYEDLEDLEMLEPGMVLSVELDRDGLVGRDLFLLTETSLERLTQHGYGPLAPAAP